MNTNTEKLFFVIDKGANIFQNELNITYLEGLAQVGEVIFQKEVIQPLTEENKKIIEEMLDGLESLENIKKEEYRRAMQLGILKGMKEGTQPHHTMTPDTVSLFIGYLVNKVMSYEKKDNSQPAVILDPAVGAGNLLTAVMNQMNNNAHGIGADADETLLSIAFVSSNLQEHSIDLLHQDSIASPFVKNVDVVVSDLPIGLYPKEQVAKDYELASEEGKSFVHHLLMEQSFKHVKPGGFLFFVVPNFLFESEEAKNLHTFIKKEGYIYSFMQLPKTMFKSNSWGKSILVLRKKKAEINPPKQALLVELPSFSNESALSDMTKRISQWFDDYLRNE
ncbi:site-specific DNA-methyltransferase (adenine-specific) [Evansella vedderi]|uniref:Site-specific DNA-methyltransferase (Adenine-specific) n=1 Tax=Evansella vedderi TaxID=38282 RepID=A0ABT9ZY15_9BACI|nr:class I SAM-dependent methyltransferase [Evansella vedderi]MDQ0255025.1 site-specific DNA-methyltransferase (adenine-specific) [Evansella vedderi]